MDVLPEFELIRPTSMEELRAAKKAHPGARLVGGGTDLVVNIRRGIGDSPAALIDTNNVADMKAITVNEDGLTIGASARLVDVAGHEALASHFPVVAKAAGSIAGPTHRLMGTVGGNICLDTRCMYYNQSEWWREANNYCLKYQGVKCHVAPKSKVCFATFSGDLAPALMILDGEVEIVGAGGTRRIPLDALYTGDGQFYMTLKEDEFVSAVHAKKIDNLKTDYDKMRVRRSIDYPLAGVAVGVRRDGDTIADLRIAFTGTNPRPVLIDGLDELTGVALSQETHDRIDDLIRAQLMAMKTTVTPGHYRRRVAGVLAHRLIDRLYEEGA